MAYTPKKWFDQPGAPQLPQGSDLNRIEKGIAANDAAITTNDAAAAHKAGAETLAGVKSFTSVITALAGMALNAAVGTARDITFQTSGSPRWILRAANTAEGGGDAGSEFQIISRTDAGASKATVLEARRSTGQVLITAYPVKILAAATGSRPAAGTAGAGSMMYDTTLGKPIWSDGTNWRDATGTTV